MGGSVIIGYQERFARWRKKLGRNTDYLVEQVRTRIVPEFEKRGFVWLKNMEPPAVKNLNYITLLKRSGTDWPIVEIHFDKRGRPFFVIEVSVLPPVCKQLTPSTIIDIPRSGAYLVNGPVYLRLQRKPSPRSALFGYLTVDALFRNPLRIIVYLLSPKRYLRKEIDKVLSLLPVLFELFERGIPNEWMTTEPKCFSVSDHFALLSSWHLAEQAYKSGKPGKIKYEGMKE